MHASLAVKQRRLTLLRHAVAALEREVWIEMMHELASLPQAYGFASVSKFAEAVLRASRRHPPRKRSRKRKRAPIVNEEVCAFVERLTFARIPNASISRITGLSQGAIRQVKRSLGLVHRSNDTTDYGKARIVFRAEAAQNKCGSVRHAA